jgi:DNA-binding LacI/PurR family transcriptional regulator
MNKKKVTIRDIAKIAGVSHSTVSRSLNDNDMIPEKTRDRIKEIAKELGFEFNYSARSLSTSKTGTIGLIFPLGFDDIATGPFFNSMINGIRKQLAQTSYDTIIDFPKNPFTGESNIKKLINRRKVDGLLLVVQTLNEDEWRFILDSKIPTIFLHFRPPTSAAGKVEFVCTDNFSGGYLATEHLIQLGHKNILTFTGKEGYEFENRTMGYKTVLADNNLEVDEKKIVFCDISYDAAYECVKSSIEMIKQSSAIFAQTDIMALGIMAALKDFGIRVPEDISVIGYDDIEYGKYHTPKLTTIHQPAEKLIEMGCKRLVDKLSGKKSEKLQKVI